MLSKNKPKRWVHGSVGWSAGKCRCIFSGVWIYSWSQPPIWFTAVKQTTAPPRISTENWIISVLTTALKPPKYVYIAENTPSIVISIAILIILFECKNDSCSPKTKSAA